MKGIIIKSTGSWYKIKQADGSTLDARVKGKFRLKDITTTICNINYESKDPKILHIKKDHETIRSY